MGHNASLGKERSAHQGSPRQDQQGKDVEVGVQVVGEKFHQPGEVPKKKVGRGQNPKSLIL